MMLRSLTLVVSLLRLIVYGQINLYDTDRIFDTGRLQFDCLHYYAHGGSVDTQSDNSLKQVIKYCIRPVDELSVLLPNHSTHNNNFTFEQLRYLNVTVQQLLSWSASIDLVERYLLYISQSIINVSSSNELFYNCTSPWFGSRCQYSFPVNSDRSFSIIFETMFKLMEKYKENSIPLTNLTCYNHLKCDRGGSHLCLDWREVCNGRIDCIDGGADEEDCFEMEMNECNEAEYRCHNGLCIPKDFWHDDENNPDCLDRSDESNIPSSFDSCYRVPTFRCEEHSCRPGKEDFPCGDGQCVQDFHSCGNGRTNLLKQSLLAKDDLLKECWIYLACFALIINNYDPDLCSSVIYDLKEDYKSHLSICKTLSQFPTVYALNGHIRFLYHNNQRVTFIKRLFKDGKAIGDDISLLSVHNLGMLGSSMLNPATFGRSIPNYDLSGSFFYPFFLGSLVTPTLSQLIDDLMNPFSHYKPVPSNIFEGPPNSSFFYHMRHLFFFNMDEITYFCSILPDYICYDANLCDFILPTFPHKNLTCRHRHQIEIPATRDYRDFTLAIKDYFRGCSTAYNTEHDSKIRVHSSLYCCHNSSKCISKHRLLDGINDCHMGDDETYEFSCWLNDQFRFKCGEKVNQCFSPIVTADICEMHLKDSIHKIYFQNLCNGVVDLFPQEIDGKMYTDETECKYWPCDHIYTRCDNIWTCHDGRDEDNCIESECSSRTRPCVLPENYTLICLSLDRVNDGIIDCLGASDEHEYCFNTNHSLPSEKTFHCSENNKCIPSSSLCDREYDCPLDDDEHFCESDEKICSENQIGNRTEIEDILCQLFNKRSDHVYFSLKTSSGYPSSTKSDPLQLDVPPAERLKVVSTTEYDDDDENELNNITWTPNCNRGIYIRTRLDDEHESYKCFCPPGYYGDLCQYQNQRVSLTLRLLPVDRHSVYAILVKLIDENDEINSYEQFTFMASWGCKIKFNIYLLYSTRPKNISKNYSVRIDVFDKSTLMYYTSWHLPIPFAFLPVNRLVAQLALPVQRTLTPHSCNLTCNNSGQCMKYDNTQEFFCQCPANWSGSQCDKPVHCGDCSFDSICVGSANNRSICICPSNKAGPRCLLPSTCPANACKNSGRCVLVDDNIGSNNYLCICSDKYYGLNCEHSKRTLKIFP